MYARFTHTTETYHKYEQSINDNNGSSWSKEQLSEPSEITVLDRCGPVGNVVLCSYFASDGLCATQSPAARYVCNCSFENGVQFQNGALLFSTHTHAHTRIFSLLHNHLDRLQFAFDLTVTTLQVMPSAAICAAAIRAGSPSRSLCLSFSFLSLLFLSRARALFRSLSLSVHLSLSRPISLSTLHVTKRHSNYRKKGQRFCRSNTRWAEIRVGVLENWKRCPLAIVLNCNTLQHTATLCNTI